MKKSLIFLSIIFLRLISNVYAQSVEVREYVHTGDKENQWNCKGSIGDLKRSVLPKEAFQSHHGKCWKNVMEQENITKTELGITQKDKANNLFNIYAASNIQQQKRIQDHYNSTAILAKLQAQAACTAMGEKGKMIFAMKRPNTKTMPKCSQLCQKVNSHNKEGQTGACFNALHIYATAKSFNDLSKKKNPIQSFGVHKYGYGGCNDGENPNYCCCQVIN